MMKRITSKKIISFYLFHNLLVTFILKVTSSCYSPPGHYSNDNQRTGGCSDPPASQNPYHDFSSRSGHSNWWTTDDQFSRFYPTNNNLMVAASSYHPYYSPIHMQGSNAAIYRTGTQPNYYGYDQRRMQMPYASSRSYPYYDPYNRNPYQSNPMLIHPQSRPTSYAQAMYGSMYYPNTRSYQDQYMNPFLPTHQQYPFPYGRNVVVKEAVAYMKGNPSSSIAGSIEFCQLGTAGVRVKGRLTGVPGPQGNRGLHILKDTSCPPLAQFPIESSALEHYNPFNSPTHGSRDSANKHVGDLGNIFVQYDGVAIIDFTTMSQLSLDDPNYSVVNHSIVLTDREDDLGSHPNDVESRRNGNSGRAIACGIITLRHSSNNYQQNYPNYPNSYDQYNYMYPGNEYSPYQQFQPQGYPQMDQFYRRSSYPNQYTSNSRPQYPQYNPTPFNPYNFKKK